jgi:excisionase family DNA binding protein
VEQKQTMTNMKTERIVIAGRNYYNAYQLSELLGVSLPTVYRWDNEGVLPRLRLGRRRLYPEDGIAGWLVSCETIGDN